MQMREGGLFREIILDCQTKMGEGVLVSSRGKVLEKIELSKIEKYIIHKLLYSVYFTFYFFSKLKDIVKNLKVKSVF